MNPSIDKEKLILKVVENEVRNDVFKYQRTDYVDIKKLQEIIRDLLGDFITKEEHELIIQGIHNVLPEWNGNETISEDLQA